MVEVELKEVGGSILGQHISGNKQAILKGRSSRAMSLLARLRHAAMSDLSPELRSKADVASPARMPSRAS
jgi:hypothetical protein